MEYSLKYDYIKRCIEYGLKYYYKNNFHYAYVKNGKLYGNFCDVDVEIDEYNIKFLYPQSCNKYLHVYDKVTKKILTVRVVKHNTNLKKIQDSINEKFNKYELEFHILNTNKKEVLLYKQ